MNTKSKVKSCICHHYRQTIRMIEEETSVLRVIASVVLIERAGISIILEVRERKAYLVIRLLTC